jgi:DHA2 family methylenomycin A resistance protein-like MFS transporter
MLWIDESTISRGSGLDPGGQILAVSWLGTLSYGLIQVADHGWTNPIVVGLLIFSLAALTLFIAVELRQRHPMLEIRLFVNLPFAVSTFAAAALGFSAFSMLFFLPTFLQRVQHYSALGAGLLLLPLPISTMLAGGIAGRWCARAGRPWVPMLTGLVLLTTALMGLLAVRSSDTSTILVPLLVFLGLGGGLTLATTNIAALAATSSAATGTASAILLAIRQTGNLLGIALLGALLATRVTADLGGSHDLQPLAESTRHFNELPLGRSTAMATLVRPIDPASGFANPSLDQSSPLRYSANQFAEAYTSGLHIAALAAAGFTFAATLLTVVFIRRSSGAKQEKGRVDGRVSAI